MKKVYGTTITKAQIEEVNEWIGYDKDDDLMSKFGYAFYYNQMQHGLDVCDADRYANLNTILGYDVGFVKFRSLDSWMWVYGHDLMELTGSNEDMEWLQKATQASKTKDLDYSKWTDLTGQRRGYSYFEKGECVERGFEKEEIER